MNDVRNWFIEFLSEVVGKYAQAENASRELDVPGTEVDKNEEGNRKVGVA